MTRRPLAGLARPGPLAVAGFRRIWLGLTLSKIGDQLTLVCLLWFVLELTGSGAALGLVILCFSLPGMLSGPYIGQLLDRLPARRVMVADNLARAVVIAAIPALHALGWLSIGAIYLLALTAGALAPATEVGVRVVLPGLLPDEQLEPANALLSASEQIAYLVGPALAGLLSAWVGPAPVLLLDAATFAAMALLIGLAPEPGRGAPAAAEQAGAPGWRVALAVLRRPAVGALILLSFAFNAAYGPLEPALPIYSQRDLAAGVMGYGLLWSAFGLGALLGLLLVGPLASLGRPGLVCALSTALWGLLLAPLALVDSLGPALAWIALAGCAWAPYIPIETSAIQRLTPPGQQGQVLGVRAAALIGAIPLGVLAGGLLLEQLSAAAVIGLSALACVIAGLAGLLAPALRGLRQ